MEEQFYAAVSRFGPDPLVVPMADTEPYPAGSVVVSGQELVCAVYASTPNTRMLPLLPLPIREAGAGNADMMAAIVEGLAGVLTLGHLNFGTFCSVLCHDEAPFASWANFEALSAPYPGVLKGPGYGLDLCEEWPSGRATLREASPPGIFLGST